MKNFLIFQHLKTECCVSVELIKSQLLNIYSSTFHSYLCAVCEYIYWLVGWLLLAAVADFALPYRDA